jgi:GDPmannose 4,6-dehydratase
MKTALITGVTGQDGAYLAKLLLAKNYKIIGTSREINDDRLKWRLKYLDIINDIEFISSKTSIETILNKCHIDELYNLQGQSSVAESFTNPFETIKSNGISTLECLESIRKHSPSTKFYQASSSEIFGISNSFSKDESSRFHPRSPYAVSKLFSHFSTVNYRESYNLFAANGILFNHESPLRPDNFVTKKITKAVVDIQNGKQDKLFIGNLNSARDWGHAKDYVNGMHLILQHHTAEDFVLSTGDATTVRKFIEKSFNYFNVKIAWRGEGVNEKGFDLGSNKCVVEVDPKLFRPAELNMSLGNSIKARNILGWAPTYTLDHIISEMIEFEITHFSKTLR